MKKLLIIVSGMLVGLTAAAQSVAVYQGSDELLNFSPNEIDSIVFKAENPKEPISTKRYVDGTWCSLGTSITWYNNNVSFANGRFTRGYQDRVMDKIEFNELINKGDNGGWVQRTIDRNCVVKADYYTIEHGVNDWGTKVKPGTFDDYVNNTKNGTFAASYRLLIEKIYEVNPYAKIVLCTPRKAYGFNGFNPDHWYDPKDGNYLSQYAELVRQIAAYEGLPVADFFNECGGQHNLDKLSIDVALHPNDDGYQLMANVLIKAFEKIIVD